jgi:hypothetical protein
MLCSFRVVGGKSRPCRVQLGTPEEAWRRFASELPGRRLIFLIPSRLEGETLWNVCFILTLACL